MRPFAAVLLLLSYAEPVPAQDIRPPTADSALIATIRALKDSQIVRTATLGSDGFEGRVLLRSDTLLLLEENEAPLLISPASIDTLWVRGTSVGKGLAWGAGIGAVLGLASGIFITQAFCQDSDSGCENEHAQIILVTSLVGLGAGTLTGAIIGALSPRWEQRWP